MNVFEPIEGSIHGQLPLIQSTQMKQKNNQSSQLSIISDLSSPKEGPNHSSKDHVSQSCIPKIKVPVILSQNQSLMQRPKCSIDPSLNYTYLDQLHSNQNKMIEKFYNILTQRAHMFKLLPEGLKWRILQVYKNEKEDEIKPLKNLPPRITFQGDSLFFLSWDSLGSLFYFYILWVAPFVASFGQLKSFVYFNVIVSLYLMIDILFTFNRSIIFQGKLVDDRKAIIEAYVMQGYFLIDFLTLISWVIELIIDEGLLLEVLMILLALGTARKLKQRIEYFLETSMISTNYLVDCTLVLTQVYYCSHFIACIFHFASKYSSEESNWIRVYGFEAADLWIRYCQSFYMAVAAVTTIGQSHITPQNPFEQVIFSLNMILSMLVFTYTLSSLGAILLHQSDQNACYRQYLQLERSKLVQLNKYMKNHSVSSKIQAKVRDHFKTCLSTKADPPISHLIDQLSDSLKSELNGHIQLAVLKKVHFLNKIFCNSTFGEVAQALETIDYAAGSFIYKAGELNSNLYIIRQGQVSITEENSQTKLASKFPQQVIGLEGFFAGTKSRTSAKCSTQCELLRLDRAKFLSILKKSGRSELVTYCHIRDCLIFKHDFFLVDSPCSICKRYNHPEVDCPSITFKPDVEFLLKKTDFRSRQNYRRKFSRTRCKINYRRQIVQFQNNIAMYLAERLPVTPTENLDSKYGCSGTSDRRQSIVYHSKQSSVSLSCRASDIPQTMMQVLSEQQQSFPIDAVCSYQKYMPQHNLDFLIKNQANWQRKPLSGYSKYSFYQGVREKIANYYMKMSD